MKGIYFEELRRAFRNRRLWIVLALTVVGLMMGMYRRGLIFAALPMHPVNLLIDVIYYTPFSLFAALLATLPYADSFLDDRNYGFIRFIALRVPFRKYLAAKSLAVATMGGVAVSGSMLLMQVLLALAGPVDLSTHAYFSNSTLASSVPWGPLGWLYGASPFAYLAFLLLIGFVFGCTYALLGLAVSALVCNRYIVLAIPLVFYQVFAYLEERSLHILPAWNPHYALFPYEAYEGFGLTNLVLQYGCLLVAALACLALFARKTRMVQ